ncbi:MAG: ACT domain-containing protein [Eubacterium sp.]|jgi:ACT domain-containing protein|nr:ACT domain-containing protein [Eubacterium sp.]
MKAVITVTGKDMIGILANISGICAEMSVNVMDVTQTILQDLFAMIMMADITQCTVPFEVFSEKLKKLGKEMNLQVHVMHEDIFNSMHRI